MISTTSAGVIAPPSREPACVAPWAKPRSVGNIQRESDRVAIGKAPASPMPKRKRITAIDPALQANTVAQVKMDHQLTIRVSARRGPIRSPKPAARYLEKRVGPLKRTENPPHRHDGETELFLDGRNRGGDDHPIDVGDHVSGDRQAQDDVANTGWTRHSGLSPWLRQLDTLIYHRLPVEGL